MSGGVGSDCRYDIVGMFVSKIKYAKRYLRAIISDYKIDVEKDEQNVYNEN